MFFLKRGSFMMAIPASSEVVNSQTGCLLFVLGLDVE